MTDRLRRLSVSLATLMIVVAACSPATSPSPSASPAAISSPTPTATTPAASATPTATLSPAQLEALIAEVEASVPDVRQLEPKEDVPDRIVDEAGLRTDMKRFVSEAATPEQYAAQARFGERLGLLPTGTDLAAIQLDLLGEQVLGYYDDDTKEMAVVQRGGAFGPLERVTLAHEYTHALQDQRFGLDTLHTDDLSEGDRSLARTALVEGDATLLMQQWALGHLTFEELLEMSKAALDPGQMAVLARTPRLISRQLEFPYVEGMAFAATLFAKGGWQAVDAAYAAPPDSTEQILHPEKYATQEAPLDVPAPITAHALGKGWTDGWQDTMGELGIGIWLEPSAGTAAADAAAAGWGGDRIVMLEGPDDAWLIDWPTTWDTPEDADAFAAAADVQASSLGTPYAITHASGTNDVRVRLASTGELLQPPAS